MGLEKRLIVPLATLIACLTPAVAAGTPVSKVAVVKMQLAVKPAETKYGKLGGYDPSVLIVHAGERVRWLNVDSIPHTATSRGFPTDGRIATGSKITSRPWSSGNVLPHTQSRLFTAVRPGVYYYSCGYHFTLGQRGVIVVLP